MSVLTHIDAAGEASMVDVGDKDVTDRTGVAEGTVLMAAETLALIRSGDAKKGDVLGTARIAGIMAAKRTHDLIPLCHPLALTSVKVELATEVEPPRVTVRAVVKTTGRTGVEMEALTAVSVACLTVYDMVKAVDRGIRITDLRLVEKRGGKSGDFLADPVPDDLRPLTPVAEALRLILGSATAPTVAEPVPLLRAAGRTLARDLAALRTQPPCDVSAMDGYAVRAADVARAPATLEVLGESAAGRAFAGAIGPGQAARIFTGAPVPPGADAVVIQENTEPQNTGGGAVAAGAGRVRVMLAETPGRHIRRAGQDFREGDVLLAAGLRLGAADVALAAAMNHATLPVYRRPRVAVLATGDELVQPGGTPGPGQIVASNSFALMAVAEAAGAVTIDLGIARDDMSSLAAAFAAARAGGADLLVTLGGASVGDHDLVQRALVAEGMDLGFWRVAMRPGKPLMHGRLGAMQVLGLPGNPVSAIVCGLLFVRPLIRALCGDRHAGDDPTEAAVLAEPMPANDGRQDYVRSRILPTAEGPLRVAAGGRQDSSLLKALSDADCLVIRPPNAPAAPAGTPCRMIRLAALGA